MPPRRGRNLAPIGGHVHNACLNALMKEMWGADLDIREEEFGDDTTFLDTRDIFYNNTFVIYPHDRLQVLVPARRSASIAASSAASSSPPIALQSVQQKNHPARAAAARRQRWLGFVECC